MWKKSLAIASFITNALSAMEAPEIHLGAHSTFTAGSSNLNEGLVANHAHDPNDEFTFQGLELGAVIKFSDSIKIVSTYNAFLDDADRLDGEWEDAYLKLDDLPFSLGLRAGRIYNRTTVQNNQHLHAWDFVNASLMTTRFLGEEGLLTESAELTWEIPTLQDNFLHFSYGDAVEHAHEEEEEGDPDEVHGEEAYLTNDIYTISLTGYYYHDDFNLYHYKAHYSTGTNGYGLDGAIYGGSLQYRWRENGLEPSGRYFSIGAEWTRRDFDYASEDLSRSGNATENGYALSAEYGFNSNWNVASRFEYVEGLGTVEESPQINRTSLAITRFFHLSDHVDGHVRLQYDYEDRDEQDDSNSVWLQLQFNFGSH
jgi:hypothetical protein